MASSTYDGPRADLGVIGGSGLYALLDGEQVDVDTPFGAPSDPLTIATVGERRVAFVPRHGRDHRFPPHLVNSRANIWALRAVGVRQVLGPCAVGIVFKGSGFYRNDSRDKKAAGETPAKVDAKAETPKGDAKKSDAGSDKPASTPGKDSGSTKPATTSSSSASASSGSASSGSSTKGSAA